MRPDQIAKLKARCGELAPRLRGLEAQFRGVAASECIDPRTDQFLVDYLDEIRDELIHYERERVAADDDVL